MHLIILILNLYHIMHLLNTVFKSFNNLIHNNVFLISIICSYKRIFQLIISDMFKCFQNFNEFFKFFNVNFITSTQFYTIDVVVTL